ncbi:MAG: GGDEF domain-containing protein [Spirochaetaceae bacterium]|nr:GGDEF domain-containing protein [Spirochaetaceae bacterium]
MSIQLFRYGNLVAGALVLGAPSYYLARAVQDAQNDLIGQNLILESISRTDELTQLPNRRYILERLAQEVFGMKRTRAEMCVCIADIDHFKNVNNSFGYDVGDEVLQKVAGAISGVLRKQDVVARWGGEEFLIMLPETSITGGTVAMEKVRAAVESLRLPAYGDRISVTVTIGVAVTTGDVPIESSIVQADAALYRGKNSGRNKVVLQ